MQKHFNNGLDKITGMTSGNRKNSLGLVVLFALLVGLSGCITVGHEFQFSAIPQIQTGKTSMKDIQQIFGNPIRTGQEEGDLVWTYAHYKANILGDFEGRDLVVKFGSDNTVKSVSYNSTDPGAIK